MLTNKTFYYLLRFSAIFCWFFALMIARTTLQAQSQTQVVLKGMIVGIGIWSGLALLQRKRHVMYFVLGLCFYAIYGSLVWLYTNLVLPLYYGQNYSIELYEVLSFIYIGCGSVIIWFLLQRESRDRLNR
ncbi:MAG: hypothetical protein PVG89_01605 [Gammaproteobacteria bacterium]|jgi:hypothetical protein